METAFSSQGSQCTKDTKPCENPRQRHKRKTCPTSIFSALAGMTLLKYLWSYKKMIFFLEEKKSFLRFQKMLFYLKMIKKKNHKNKIKC